MKLIVYFLMSVILTSCSCNRKDNKYAFTAEVCEGSLHVEVFTEFGQGALGSDLMEDYLTDSTNFRIYIGEFDEGTESYYYESHNDSLIVSKTYKNKPIDPNETRYFSLSELKKLNNLSKPRESL